MSRFVISFALFAILSVLWALASPVFSSPDENAHGTRAISVAHGQLMGREDKGQLIVDLPHGYEYSDSIICFARDDRVNASCGVELGDAGGQRFFNNWVGSYNPAYYATVGWPTLFLEGSAGVYAMRIISALIAAVFLAWAFQAAFASRRTRWMPAAVAFLASPMVLYMAGSVTPQGLEIASGAALWIGLMRLLQGFDPSGEKPSLSRAYLWTIVAISAAALCVARATGPLWVVVIVGTCLVISGWRPTRALFRTPRSYIPIAVIAAAGLFSVIWTLVGGSLSGQAGSESPGAGRDFIYGAWMTIRNTPRYVEEAAGVFGWLDTVLPSFVYIAFFAAFVVLVVLALLATRRRGLLSLGLVIVVAAIVPVLVQGYSVRQTGLIWQGRYGLFLYLGIPLVAGLLLSSRLGDRVAFLSVRYTAVIASLLGAYGIVAFLLVLRRYVVGDNDHVNKMLSSPEWQPPLGWIALVVMFALVMTAFTAWIIRLAVVSGRSEQIEEPGIRPAERSASAA
ncbi:MAG: hypothetical protein JWO10_1680 [Microbacteriaceae bacterium]|nr:hypothetical protein [Microbacteriaceae bacterium]